MDQQFIFFYSHDRKKHGDKAIFSNFYPVPFQNNQGIQFLHSEQYLMWRKAVLFGDDEIAQQILEQTKPMECKKLGRKVKNFDQEIWNAQAQQIMLDALMLKFHQNPELLKILLETGDKTLVEASPRDRIWGIGMGQTNPNRFDPSKWRGHNWLGRALMKTREVLSQPVVKKLRFKSNFVEDQKGFIFHRASRRPPRPAGA